MKTVTFLMIAFLVGFPGFLMIADANELKQVGRQPMPTYNIIVLLDLSDRISPVKNPGQIAKDKAIIEHIIELFEAHVRRQLYLRSHDRLCIAIAPQVTDYAQELHQIANGLRIDMEKLRVGGKPRFDRAKQDILAHVDTLYEMASESKCYIGADIWSFFRDSLEDYVLPGTPEHPIRNVLLVLTDGYLDFEPSVQAARPHQGSRTSYMECGLFRRLDDWEHQFDSKDCGLLSFQRNFGNLEVLLLEVVLRHPRDLGILEKYWYKWFSELGIHRSKLKTTEDASVHVQAVIQQFLTTVGTSQ